MEEVVKLEHGRAGCRQSRVARTPREQGMRLDFFEQLELEMGLRHWHWEIRLT